MKPGCSELTRTPEVAQCSAAFLLSVRTAPLAAAYAALLPSPPTVPRIELRLTIEPPPEATMSGPRCFMPSQTPVESTDITSCQRSTDSSLHAGETADAGVVDEPVEPAVLALDELS